MSIKNINWSKWGVVITSVLFLITGGMWAFQTFYYERKPDLSFEIITNEEVLAVKENIRNLKILYDDVDIWKANQNISILTLKVINRGENSILKSYYDKDFPFGLQVVNGELLGTPEIIGFSDSAYFSTAIDTVNGNDVLFRELIMDSDQYFDIKLLIKNKNGIKPSVLAKGKIANVNEIMVKPLQTESKDSNFFGLPVWAGVPLTAFVFLLFSYWGWSDSRRKRDMEEVLARTEEIEKELSMKLIETTGSLIIDYKKKYALSIAKMAENLEIGITNIPLDVIREENIKPEYKEVELITEDDSPSKLGDLKSQIIGELSRNQNAKSKIVEGKKLMSSLKYDKPYYLYIFYNPYT